VIGAALRISERTASTIASFEFPSLSFDHTGTYSHCVAPFERYVGRPAAECGREQVEDFPLNLIPNMLAGDSTQPVLACARAYQRADEP
jgi:hypothetical protein